MNTDDIHVYGMVYKELIWKKGSIKNLIVMWAELREKYVESCIIKYYCIFCTAADVKKTGEWD